MFFVLLNHPKNDVPAVPLIESKTDNIAFYETFEEAGEAAESSSLGEEFGYEIFQLGQGL